MAYRLTMTEEALGFWHALWAPFQDHELSHVPRGGKTLTYVDKRALENRLDTVCGPHGWYNEFEATDRGMICTIHILVPADHRHFGCKDKDEWTWISKSDGGGAEGMVKRAGVEDEDNDFKSEFTNAFRRAAQDAWGIGRYLYQKGVPGWLDPANMPLKPGPANISRPTGDFATTKEIAGRPRDSQDDIDPVRKTPVHTPPEQLVKPVLDPVVEPLQLPRPGGSVWRWAKDMEFRFKTSIVSGMQKHAERIGISSAFSQWDEAQVQTICLGAVRYCMNQRSYKGEFEHLSDKLGVEESSSKNLAPPAGQGVNVADVRRDLMTRIRALINYQTGRDADDRESKEMFQDIAPQCTNERGDTGEVPESLAKLSDVVWIKNMIRFVDDQISHVKSNINTGDLAQTPF